MSGKSRTERVLGRMMRKPALRWMWHVLPTPPAIVLVHRGRKSGKLYETPLSILVEYPKRGELVVSPMWGRDSDWYRNVIAGGLVEIHVRTRSSSGLASLALRSRRCIGRPSGSCFVGFCG